MTHERSPWFARHGSDTQISAVKHVNDEHVALLFGMLNDE